MSAIACFDLWMSKGVYDHFALSLTFLMKSGNLRR
jgi:hypothetical protein